jgi:hypothetical protein
MEPVFCPYCGNQKIEELEPTEMMVDNDMWYIFHYECNECGETFDKIVLKDVDIEDFKEDEDEFWS